jgi:hypothetical protein
MPCLGGACWTCIGHGVCPMLLSPEQTKSGSHVAHRETRNHLLRTLSIPTPYAQHTYSMRSACLLHTLSIPTPCAQPAYCYACIPHAARFACVLDIQSKRARYACATATHAYFIRYNTYATHAYLISKASARATHAHLMHPHLMRYCYACIPHTLYACTPHTLLLRMHTLYAIRMHTSCATATHAYLIRYTHAHLMRYCYACIPHTLYACTPNTVRRIRYVLRRAGALDAAEARYCSALRYFSFTALLRLCHDSFKALIRLL